MNKIRISYGAIQNFDDASYVEYLTKFSRFVGEMSFNEETLSDELLSKAIDEVMNYIPGIENIRRYIRKQDLTIQKSESNKRRKRILNSILRQLRAKADFENDADVSEQVLSWLEGIAANLPYYSQSQLSRYIGIIEHGLETKVEIIEAIDILGIIDYFGALISENNKFRELEIENTKLFEQKNISASEKSQIRENTYTAIRNFYEALAIVMQWDETGKYDALHFWLHKTTIDARTSYKLSRKRKTSDSTEDEMDVEIFNSEMDSAQQIDCDCSDIEEDYGDDEKIV